MGQADQFAKRTFASDTLKVTRGAVAWEDAPETSLVNVQGDGLLLVRDPTQLMSLSWPWPAAGSELEILLEIKMAGDHMDVVVVERALLRRQARQVERMEEETVPPWRGRQSLWLVGPHVPAHLRAERTLEELGPGCYQVGPAAFPFVWIAANELPLREELIPFLIARSGRALDEFGLWVADRRPIHWVLEMVEYTTMSTSIRDDLAERLRTDDPEARERRDRFIRKLFEMAPDVQREVRDAGRNEGRVIEARSALRRVLVERGIALSAEDEATIEACVDLTVLHRWLGAAATAANAAQALA